jgi:hypothetical protein
MLDLKRTSMSGVGDQLVGGPMKDTEATRVVWYCGRSRRNGKDTLKPLHSL